MNPSPRLFAANSATNCSTSFVAPFVSGVYAGDPERLSLRAAFPKLHEFEAQYGSVLRGAMKSRPAEGHAARRAVLVSRWHGNISASPRRASGRFASARNQRCELRRGKANGKPWFEVDVTRRNHRETLAASAVVIATPTNIASQILQGLSDKFAPLFSRIEYAPVAVVSACYRREQIQQPPDGFGFLVPRSEGLRVLGTVFNSVALRRARAGRNGLLHQLCRRRHRSQVLRIERRRNHGNHLRRSRARPRHHGKARGDKRCIATRAPCRNTIWATPKS